VGSQTQGKKGIRLDAWPMEAPAAFRRRMGVAKVASRPWRLHIRGGPLGLTTLGLEKGIAAANMLSSCSLQAAVNYSLMQQWVWRAGAIAKMAPRSYRRTTGGPAQP
jgi:hypothetical protein